MSLALFFCCSVSKLCPTFCNSVDCSMPGFSVPHYLLEFAQVHVHWLTSSFCIPLFHFRTILVLLTEANCGANSPINRVELAQSFFFHLEAVVVKNPLANVGDTGEVNLIPGLGRSLKEDGNPLQYSCLENPIDRWATVHGVAKSRT